MTPEQKKPINPTITPPITDTDNAVCTLLLTRSPSRAPAKRATTASAPTLSPINKLVIKLMSAPVLPTAATAASLSSPANRPNTMMSAALYSNCNTAVKTNGSANSTVLPNSGRVHRSTGAFVFFSLAFILTNRFLRAIL